MKYLILITLFILSGCTIEQADPVTFSAGETVYIDNMLINGTLIEVNQPTDRISFPDCRIKIEIIDENGTKKTKEIVLSMSHVRKIKTKNVEK